jgi:hypothetical protein
MITLVSSGFEDAAGCFLTNRWKDRLARQPRGERGETRMDQSVSLRRGASCPRIAFAALGLLFAGSLGGCVETVAVSGAETPEPRAQSAANAASVNPHGVRVALASLSGVPEPLENRMKDAFATQAGERNIALVDPAKAAYLIRGYVTTYPAATGTTVAAVYDVFDANKKRAQRLEDDVVVKSEGIDPWSGFSAVAMDDLAARSADDLAAFLITTPEALAAAEPGSEADPGAPPASRTLGRQTAAHADAAQFGPEAARGATAQGPAVASGLSVAALH